MDKRAAKCPLAAGTKTTVQRIPHTVHVDQHNIILDVLGGYSKGLERTVRVLVGRKRKEVLIKMQKSVLASSLQIARHFKIMT